MLKKKFHINLYRKRKYKPLYKQFLSLKKNIQYKKETLFFKFNKIKWRKFKNNNFKDQKKFFIILDHSRYSISIFLKNVLKKKFAKKLEVKKNLFLFFCFVSFCNISFRSNSC